MSFWCLQFLPKNERKQATWGIIVVKSNFSFVFWENWECQKVLLKLTDPYQHILRWIILQVYSAVRDPRIWHLPISSIWLEKKKRNLIWTRKIIQVKKEITKNGWKIVKKRCRDTLNIKLTGLSRTCCSLNISQ